VKAEFSQYDNVSIYLYGPDGDLKDERHTHNLVVTAGKTWLATYLAGTNTSAMVMLAIGTSSTAVAAGDTGLNGEFTGQRIVGTTNASVNMYQLTGTFPANSPSSTLTTAVVEAGIFNAGTAGTMYTHAVFSAINKAPADSLTIVWQITNS
jgi:hypothetical protein